MSNTHIHFMRGVAMRGIAKGGSIRRQTTSDRNLFDETFKPFGGDAKAFLARVACETVS